MAADACSITTDRLFITDRVSNMRFLVDTGSDLCVLPRKHVPGRRERNSYDLFAANGAPTPDIGRLPILLYGSRPISCWPEAIPLQDITAETVAQALISGWIARYVCPQTITTDQGRQFESQLFHSLASISGIHLSRTTAFYPAANGLVERLHCSQKAAIICREQER